MRKRKGVSLVELLVSLTTGSALTILAMGVVQQTFVLSKRVQHRADHDRTIARLSRQFREDIHLAVGVSNGLPNALQLKTSDGSNVTYRAQANRIVREHLTGEESADAGKTNYEQYLLDEHCNLTFQSHSGPDRMELVVVRNMELANLPPRIELQVVSVVNKWRSLERSEKEMP